MASNDGNTKDGVMTPEQKRKKAIVDYVSGKLTKAMAQEYGVLQGGWVAARLSMYKDIQHATMIELMYECYMGGAQHLFASIMHGLSDGDNVMPADEAMFDRIAKELDVWAKAMHGKYLTGQATPQGPSFAAHPSDPSCKDQGPSA